MNQELTIKTGRIVEILMENRLDGVLLNAQHNFAWLTGGASNGIDLSRENGAASILVRKDGHVFLLANNIEMTRLCTEQVSVSEFEPVEIRWQDEKNGSFLFDVAKRVAGGSIASDIPLDASVSSIEGSIARCREELLPGEIERYRALGKDAGASLGRVASSLVTGESEIEIGRSIRKELALKGIESVVTLVAADGRIARFRHPVPTDNRWSKTVLLVTCAKRYGLIASLSRIVSAGNANEALKERTAAAAFVYAKLAHETKPGTTGAQLYDAAARAYSEVDFSGEIDKHHQGGATGYRTRQWLAHPVSSDTVRNSQAFAWNPSITGTKVEDTIIVSDGILETITTSPGFPLISHNIDGREFKSTGILNI